MRNEVSVSTSQRVAGHTLLYDGVDVRSWQPDGHVNHVGGCQCGAQPHSMRGSVKVPRALTRAWHRQHKAQVLAGTRPQRVNIAEVT